MKGKNFDDVGYENVPAGPRDSYQGPDEYPYSERDLKLEGEDVEPYEVQDSKKDLRRTTALICVIAAIVTIVVAISAVGLNRCLPHEEEPLPEEPLPVKTSIFAEQAETYTLTGDYTLTQEDFDAIGIGDGILAIDYPVCIDLGGYTLDLGGYEFIFTAAEKDKKITFKNGTVTNGKLRITAQNTGVEIENVTFADSCDYTISTNDSEVSVKKSEIKSKSLKAIGGKVNLSDSKVVGAWTVTSDVSASDGSVLEEVIVDAPKEVVLDFGEDTKADSVEVNSATGFKGKVDCTVNVKSAKVSLAKKSYIKIIVASNDPIQIVQENNSSIDSIQLNAESEVELAGEVKEISIEKATKMVVKYCAIIEVVELKGEGSDVEFNGTVSDFTVAAKSDVNFGIDSYVQKVEIISDATVEIDGSNAAVIVSDEDAEVVIKRDASVILLVNNTGNDKPANIDINKSAEIETVIIGVDEGKIDQAKDIFVMPIKYIAADCEEEGEVDYKAGGKIENGKDVEPEVIEIQEHVYTYKIIKPAKINEEGLGRWTCAHCDDSYDEIIPARAEVIDIATICDAFSLVIPDDEYDYALDENSGYVLDSDQYNDLIGNVVEFLDEDTSKKVIDTVGQYFGVTSDDAKNLASSWETDADKYYIALLRKAFVHLTVKKMKVYGQVVFDFAWYNPIDAADVPTNFSELTNEKAAYSVALSLVFKGSVAYYYVIENGKESTEKYSVTAQLDDLMEPTGFSCDDLLSIVNTGRKIYELATAYEASYKALYQYIEANVNEVKLEDVPQLIVSEDKDGNIVKAIDFDKFAETLTATAETRMTKLVNSALGKGTLTAIMDFAAEFPYMTMGEVEDAVLTASSNFGIEKKYLYDDLNIAIELMIDEIPYDSFGADKAAIQAKTQELCGKKEGEDGAKYDIARLIANYEDDTFYALIFGKEPTEGEEEIKAYIDAKIAFQKEYQDVLDTIDDTLSYSFADLFNMTYDTVKSVLSSAATVTAEKLEETLPASLAGAIAAVCQFAAGIGDAMPAYQNEDGECKAFEELAKYIPEAKKYFACSWTETAEGNIKAGTIDVHDEKVDATEPSWFFANFDIDNSAETPLYDVEGKINIEGYVLDFEMVDNTVLNVVLNARPVTASYSYTETDGYKTHFDYDVDTFILDLECNPESKYVINASFTNKVEPGVVYDYYSLNLNYAVDEISVHCDGKVDVIYSDYTNAESQEAAAKKSFEAFSFMYDRATEDGVTIAQTAVTVDKLGFSMNGNYTETSNGKIGATFIVNVVNPKSTDQQWVNYTASYVADANGELDAKMGLYVDDCTYYVDLSYDKDAASAESEYDYTIDSYVSVGIPNIVSIGAAYNGTEKDGLIAKTAFVNAHFGNSVADLTVNYNSTAISAKDAEEVVAPATVKIADCKATFSMSGETKAEMTYEKYAEENKTSYIHELKVPALWTKAIEVVYKENLKGEFAGASLTVYDENDAVIGQGNYEVFEKDTEIKYIYGLSVPQYFTADVAYAYDEEVCILADVTVAIELSSGEAVFSVGHNRTPVTELVDEDEVEKEGAYTYEYYIHGASYFDATAVYTDDNGTIKGANVTIALAVIYPITIEATHETVVDEEKETVKQDYSLTVSDLFAATGKYYTEKGEISLGEIAVDVDKLTGENILVKHSVTDGDKAFDIEFVKAVSVDVSVNGTFEVQEEEEVEGEGAGIVFSGEIDILHLPVNATWTTENLEIPFTFKMVEIIDEDKEPDDESVSTLYSLNIKDLIKLDYTDIRLDGEHIEFNLEGDIRCVKEVTIKDSNKKDVVIASVGEKYLDFEVGKTADWARFHHSAELYSIIWRTIEYNDPTAKPLTYAISYDKEVGVENFCNVDLWGDNVIKTAWTFNENFMNGGELIRYDTKYDWASIKECTTPDELALWFINAVLYILTPDYLDERIKNFEPSQMSEVIADIVGIDSFRYESDERCLEKVAKGYDAKAGTKRYSYDLVEWARNSGIKTLEINYSNNHYNRYENTYTIDAKNRKTSVIKKDNYIEFASDPENNKELIKTDSKFYYEYSDVLDDEDQVIGWKMAENNVTNHDNITTAEYIFDEKLTVYTWDVAYNKLAKIDDIPETCYTFIIDDTVGEEKIFINMIANLGTTYGYRYDEELSDYVDVLGDAKNPDNIIEGFKLDVTPVKAEMNAQYYDVKMNEAQTAFVNYTTEHYYCLIEKDNILYTTTHGGIVYDDVYFKYDGKTMCCEQSGVDKDYLVCVMRERGMISTSSETDYSWSTKAENKWLRLTQEEKDLLLVQSMAYLDFIRYNNFHEKLTFDEYWSTIVTEEMIEGYKNDLRQPIFNATVDKTAEKTKYGFSDIYYVTDLFGEHMADTEYKRVLNLALLTYGTESEKAGEINGFAFDYDYGSNNRESLSNLIKNLLDLLAEMIIEKYFSSYPQSTKDEYRSKWAEPVIAILDGAIGLYLLRWYVQTDDRDVVYIGLGESNNTPDIGGYKTEYALKWDVDFENKLCDIVLGHSENEKEQYLYDFIFNDEECVGTVRTWEYENYGRSYTECKEYTWAIDRVEATGFLTKTVTDLKKTKDEKDPSKYYNKETSKTISTYSWENYKDAGKLGKYIVETDPNTTQYTKTVFAFGLDTENTYVTAEVTLTNNTMFTCDTVAAKKGSTERVITAIVAGNYTAVIDVKDYPAAEEPEETVESEEAVEPEKVNGKEVAVEVKFGEKDYKATFALNTEKVWSYVYFEDATIVEGKPVVSMYVKGNLTDYTVDEEEVSGKEVDLEVKFGDKDYKAQFGLDAEKALAHIYYEDADLLQGEVLTSTVLKFDLTDDKDEKVATLYQNIFDEVEAKFTLNCEAIEATLAAQYNKVANNEKYDICTFNFTMLNNKNGGKDIEAVFHGAKELFDEDEDLEYSAKLVYTIVEDKYTFVGYYNGKEGGVITYTNTEDLFEITARYLYECDKVKDIDFSVEKGEVNKVNLKSDAWGITFGGTVSEFVIGMTGTILGYKVNVESADETHFKVTATSGMREYVFSFDGNKIVFNKINISKLTEVEEKTLAFGLELYANWDNTFDEEDGAFLQNDFGFGAKLTTKDDESRVHFGWLLDFDTEYTVPDIDVEKYATVLPTYLPSYIAR